MTSEYEPIPANADGTRLACAVCGEEFDAGEASRHYYAEHRREWKIVFSELLGEDASTVRWSFFDDMQITVGGKKL